MAYSAPSVDQRQPAPKRGKKQRGESVEQLVKDYENFVEVKAQEIEEQRVFRHYYHGDQWTAEERKTLNDRKQPVITSNRVGRKIDAVVGLVERMRTDPKAYARTPKEEDGAELATAVLRYIMDAARWEEISPQASLNAAINGIGVVEMGLEPGDNGDPDVTLSIVDPDVFFYDPRSFRPDFSDARFMGIVKWVDLEEAQAMFPDKEEELEGLLEGQGVAESWQQQDRERKWVDVERQRVRLVEHWYRRKGEWYWCFYVGRHVKLADGTSPFYDEKGKTVCRFLAFSSNVDHDGDRYGFIRNMKSAQDEINARRSKALHLLNTRRVIADRNAVEDVEKARREWARPDGWVEKNHGTELTPDPTEQADFAGQIQFLEESKTEIENFGPNPAVMGEGVEKSSGRAIALLQQAGIAELGPFILAYRNWKMRIYRAAWCAVKHHWTAERWVRVTDHEGVAQFVQVNGVGLDPQTGQPTMINAVGSLDVDVILDEGPDTQSMMMDTYETMSTLAQNGAPIPPDVLIELAPIQSSVKQRILERLRQPPEPDPMEQENARAEIGATKAKALKDFASATKDMGEATMPPEMGQGFRGEGQMANPQRQVS